MQDDSGKVGDNMNIMERRTMYLALAVVGAVVPMTQFVPWMLAHGADVALFRRELFINRISSFFALDLLLTALVAVCFGAAERVRYRWVAFLVMLLLGVSAGLPLLLYFRESDRQA